MNFFAQTYSKSKDIYNEYQNTIEGKQSPLSPAGISHLKTIRDALFFSKIEATAPSIITTLLTPLVLPSLLWLTTAAVLVKSLINFAQAMIEKKSILSDDIRINELMNQGRNLLVLTGLLGISALAGTILAYISPISRLYITLKEGAKNDEGIAGMKFS